MNTVHTESYNTKSKHVNADPRFCPLGGSIPCSLYDTFTPLLFSVAAEWIHGDRKNQIVVCLVSCVQEWRKDTGQTNVSNLLQGTQSKS